MMLYLDGDTNVRLGFALSGLDKDPICTINLQLTIFSGMHRNGAGRCRNRT